MFPLKIHLSKDSLVRVEVYLRAMASYLSRGLDSLPKTEVEQDNYHSQTGGQLPAWTAKIVNTVAVLNVKHCSPLGGKETLVTGRRVSEHELQADLEVSQGLAVVVKHCMWVDELMQKETPYLHKFSEFKFLLMLRLPFLNSYVISLKY